MMSKKYGFTIIVTSDTACINPSYNVTGKFIRTELKELPFLDYHNEFVLPDRTESIIECLKQEVNDGRHLIITTGGTGLCPNDVTPEATSSLYDRSCPGIKMALMLKGLQHTPHAALSRLTAGIIKKTLVINFPGSLKACEQCIDTIRPLLKHALDQINHDRKAIEKIHLEQEQAIERENRMKDNSATKYLDNQSNISTSSKLIDKILINHSIEESLNPSIQCSHKLVEYSEALNLLKENSKSTSLFHHEPATLICNNESLVSSLGEYLAEDTTSMVNIPNHAVSTMDGYVLNLSERMANKSKSFGIINATIVSNLKEFNIKKSSKADHDSFFCYQVNTGGEVPASDFAVIPFEHTGPISHKRLVPIYKVEPGKYTRGEGSDLDKKFVMKKGTKMGPIEISTLISMGHECFEKVTKPTITILSTGDEIVDGTSRHGSLKVKDDEVIDTNGPMLKCLFTQYGIESLYMGVVKDTLEKLTIGVSNSIDQSDILIITGGASMGTRDFVKYLIGANFGAKIKFGRVNIKPGKPAGFATIDQGRRTRFIFCLPGNPVSAYITSLVLVIPFLRYSMMDFLGLPYPEKELEILGTIINVEVALIEDLDEEAGEKAYQFDGRFEFVRAKFSFQSDNQGLNRRKVSVSAKQQSSRLLSLKDFDCLLLVKPSNKGSSFVVGQDYEAVTLKNCLL